MKLLQNTLLLLVGILLGISPQGLAQPSTPGSHPGISGSYDLSRESAADDTVEVTGEANLLTAKFVGIPDQLPVGETVTIEVLPEVKRLLWDIPKKVFYVSAVNVNAPFIPLGPNIGRTDLSEAAGRGKYEGTVEYHCAEVGEGSFAGTVVVDLPDDSAFRKKLEASVDEPVECVEEESESQTLRILKDGDGEGTVKGSPGDIKIPGGRNSEDYDEGTEVVLVAEATPYSNSYFDGWSGNLEGTREQTFDSINRLTVPMNQARTITATFKRYNDEKDEQSDTNATGQDVRVSFRDTRTMNFARSDAAPSEKGTGFVEAGFNYNSFEFENIYDINLQGEYAFCDNLAAGAEIGYRTFSFENDMLDNRSRFKDPELSGWYGFYSDDRTNVVAGARATIPVGNEEEINQGKFDYGVFGTVRYQLSDNLVGVGQINLNSYEPDFEQENREYVFGAKGSLMYGLTNNITAFGEFSFQGETEFAFRPAQYDYGKVGIGYHTPISFDFRAAVGTGFGEQTADSIFELKIGKSLNF